MYANEVINRTLNIHVCLRYSSSGLKEDKMTNYSIIEIKLFPFNAFIFLFQSHFFPRFWFCLFISGRGVYFFPVLWNKSLEITKTIFVYESG